jgi:hypothetical protein
MVVEGSGMRRRRWLVGAASGAVLAAGAGGAAWWFTRDPAVFDGLPGTVVRFATAEEGAAVLGAQDDWIAATSALQRAALMGMDPPVHRRAFARFQAEQVLPWPVAERERWKRALAALVPAFERLAVPLPAQVLLVNTTGRESENTPHSRANAIVLPTAQLDTQNYSDVEVLAHELFHVMTRHQPDFATRLYATIGFEPAPPLQWPPGWQELRIANQDAPHHRHLMRVVIDGTRRAVMPVVVASYRTLDMKGGDTLAGVMEPRLLEVRVDAAANASVPVLRGGEPVWHDPEATADYLRRLGGNTDYVLHPEETLADNFMLMVSGRPVPNPGLHKRIEAVFLARER